MNQFDSLVPEENLSTYRLLFAIEVGLRELIIATLAAKCGAFWYKHRLPGDILAAYREGSNQQRRTKWLQLVPHHPIYYIDFPHLRVVIEQSDNWEDVFKEMFERKDVFVATLSELEPIRNAVAHNRKVSREDLRVVEAAYNKISAAIGNDRFLSLACRCTSAHDIPESLALLRQEADAAQTCCMSYRPLRPLRAWERVSEAWWFDEDYLGCDLAAITLYFEILERYQQLPRHRGSGHSIEAWVHASGIEARYADAVQGFLLLGADGKEGA
jgi:hypothetical protein